jgi:hypothetical protein
MPFPESVVQGGVSTRVAVPCPMKNYGEQNAYEVRSRYKLEKWNCEKPRPNLGVHSLFGKLTRFR